jgi:hypothetical protein
MNLSAVTYCRYSDTISNYAFMITLVQIRPYTTRILFYNFMTGQNSSTHSELKWPTELANVSCKNISWTKTKYY